MEQKKVRHVLGISGGKDSAALAIYMNQLYPDLDLEYYTCDTGKELDETYQLIENLEVYLGKEIYKIQAAKNSLDNPFDHLLKMKGGYLPSHFARWCTKEMKLQPFEKWVGNDPVVSYDGIRGDEDREGYISTKPNIQSIFPFRTNIWSQDVIQKVLANSNRKQVATYYEHFAQSTKLSRTLEIVQEPLSIRFKQERKLNLLLDLDIQAFNQVVFEFLQTTNYTLAGVEHFPVVNNTDRLIREDIFNLLRESGVGVPAYYEKLPYQVNGQTGHYSRSRSGCYFCFFQQKIEWVWLYEQHPDLFQRALDYEKEGYSWSEERLENLIQPDRIHQIKAEHLQRMQRLKANTKSPYLIDILEDAEGTGCAACFI